MKEPSVPTSYIACYVIIALSAVLILVPASRSLPFAKVAASLSLFVLLADSVRRGVKRGQMKLTMPEIYSQAKRGRKFAPVALELATTVVALIAFWMTI